MTLQNGLIHSGAGYLWTDTAALDPKTGKLMGHIPKAFFGQTWPWAAVYSGAALLEDPGRIARAVASADPINMTELLAACVTSLREDEMAAQSCGRLLVCCACPRTGPRLWLICTDETPHCKPYVPEEFVQFMSSGNGLPPPDGIDLDALTPGTMAEFIDWQIPLRTGTVCGLDQPTIGGNILELQVSAAGVEQRIIRKMVGIAANLPDASHE